MSKNVGICFLVYCSNRAHGSPAFGEIKDILISSCSFDQLDNPFLVTLNEGTGESGSVWSI